MFQPPQNIILVDTDPRRLDAISYHFEAKGCQVDIFSNGQAALEFSREHAPDLLITNWMLPGMTGLELTQAIRKDPNLQLLPVYVTGIGHDRVSQMRAIDAGANGYFQGKNMIAELVQQFEVDFDLGPKTPVTKPISAAGIVIEPINQTVFFAGRKLRLSPTEYTILKLLVSRPDKVFTRRAIIDFIWGKDAVIEHRTVDVQMGRLRKALKNEAGTTPIKTIHGKGYKLSE